MLMVMMMMTTRTTMMLMMMVVICLCMGLALGSLQRWHKGRAFLSSSEPGCGHACRVAPGSLPGIIFILII
eukprot:2430600-Karenia_brevis.AAC.1